MKKALVFLANGFEEIEAITPVDILRRAGIEVKTCSIQEELSVTGANGIKIEADIMLKDVNNADSYDILITPGGMPGATNLRNNETVVELISSFFDREGKYIASICAAPMVLGKAGITTELSGTCYPGFEAKAGFKNYLKEAVVVDKNVITSMGPGTAFLLALKIVEVLMGKAASDKIAEDTLLAHALKA